MKDEIIQAHRERCKSSKPMMFPANANIEVTNSKDDEFYRIDSWVNIARKDDLPEEYTSSNNTFWEITLEDGKKAIFLHQSDFIGGDFLLERGKIINKMLMHELSITFISATNKLTRIMRKKREAYENEVKNQIPRRIMQHKGQFTLRVPGYPKLWVTFRKILEEQNLPEDAREFRIQSYHPEMARYSWIIREKAVPVFGEDYEGDDIADLVWPSKNRGAILSYDEFVVLAQQMKIAIPFLISLCQAYKLPPEFLTGAGSSSGGELDSLQPKHNVMGIDVGKMAKEVEELSAEIDREHLRSLRTVQFADRASRYVAIDRRSQGILIKQTKKHSWIKVTYHPTKKKRIGKIIKIRTEGNMQYL